MTGLVLAFASAILAAAPYSAEPEQQTSVQTAAITRSCLPIQTIRQTRVVDDKTVDFITRDGTVWRNTLPNACPMLGFERAFSYATSIPQLCSVDIITVFQQSYGVRQGASCGLGKFVNIGPDTPANRDRTRKSAKGD